MAGTLKIPDRAPIARSDRVNDLWLLFFVALTARVAASYPTPSPLPLLATGAGHTVDDVITALQTLGLVRQV